MAFPGVATGEEGAGPSAPLVGEEEEEVALGDEGALVAAVVSNESKA